MPRKINQLKAVATLGIDIGKNTFHLVGFDGKGAIVLRQRLSRTQVEGRLANMPPCLIGMEACVGAHHLSRQLKAYGHDARLTVARIAAAAEADGQYAAAVAANKEIGVLAGIRIERREQGAPHEFAKLSTDDLLRELEALGIRVVLEHDIDGEVVGEVVGSDDAAR